MLGRGGMSEIYLAHDSRLVNKAVVIKIMSDHASRHEWMSQKFQQEIEALSRVVHPGIVTVLDSGKTPDGRSYMVMDYVEGHTLRNELISGELSFRRISDIIQQVSNALGAAHEHGIIHRDLKPENVMISKLPEGYDRVRLIDFGIAKIKASVVGTTTVTGLFAAGTVAYMSPEQLRGEKITPASDIYALGIIAFEMVTGRRPFAAETMFQLSAKQQAGVTVLPSSLRPKLPRSTEQAILKALSFDPRERYQRAQEFAAAFIRALK
jgi:serine/threonine protein kinase